MRTEAEIRRALAIMMNPISDAAGMGETSRLIGYVFVGTLRFVLNDGDSPWPKWLDDMEKAQRQ